jgi:hypothetical protein
MVSLVGGARLLLSLSDGDSRSSRRDEAARRKVSFQDDHASGPGQATSATRRHGRIGHEQIFVAKTRLRTLCTQAGNIFSLDRGRSSAPLETVGTLLQDAATYQLCPAMRE